MKFLVYQTEDVNTCIGFVLAETPQQAIAHAKKKYREPSPIVASEDGTLERAMIEAYEKETNS